MKSDELEKEILALLDGTLSAAGAKTLMLRLAEDSDARRLYYECVSLHQLLGFRFGRPVTGKDAASRTVEKRRLETRRNAITSIVVSAAAIIVLGLLLHAFLAKDPDRLGTFAVSEGTRFSVGHGADATVGEGELSEGSEVVLEQGVLEISFASGSKAVIQAPSRFELVDKRHIKISSGVAFFSIEKEDIGFKAETPAMIVEDLGTRFGIIAREGSPEEVHVLQGSVRVTPKLAEFGSVLVKNEARSVNPIGRLESVRCERSKFLESLPPGLPEIRFTFEAPGPPNSGIVVEGMLPGAERMAARYLDADGRPAIPRYVPGVIGTAISMKGDGDFIDTDWMGLAGSASRSVSFWTRLDEDADLSRFPAVAGWGDSAGGPSNGKWKVMLVRTKGSGPAVARISIGAVGWDGSDGLADGTWHHVVMIYDNHPPGGTAQSFSLYIDGLERPLAKQRFSEIEPPYIPDTRTRHSLARPLRIGVSVEPRGMSFPGQLDDLRIFAGALSRKQVTDLYSLKN